MADSVRSLNDALDRLDAILTGEPFGFIKTIEPFGFDLQPSQKLDRTYCLLAGRGRAGGLIGFQQAEVVPVSIRIARLVRRDAIAAMRLLNTDCSSLTAAIARDGVNGDYNADVEPPQVREPGPEDEHVVGELIALVDYERPL